MPQPQGGSSLPGALFPDYELRSDHWSFIETPSRELVFSVGGLINVDIETLDGLYSNANRPPISVFARASGDARNVWTENANLCLYCS